MARAGPSRSRTARAARAARRACRAAGSPRRPRGSDVAHRRRGPRRFLPASTNAFIPPAEIAHRATGRARIASSHLPMRSASQRRTGRGASPRPGGERRESIDERGERRREVGLPRLRADEHARPAPAARRSIIIVLPPTQRTVCGASPEAPQLQPLDPPAVRSRPATPGTRIATASGNTARSGSPSLAPPRRALARPARRARRSSASAATPRRTPA